MKLFSSLSKTAVFAVVFAGLSACSYLNFGADAEEVVELSSLTPHLMAAHRTDTDKARDEFRHPKETLEFFGLSPDMTVVELWPGGGYYLNILAPWIHEGGGTYYAAQFWQDSSENERIQNAIKNFNEMIAAKPELYGSTKRSLMNPREMNLAPDGPVDAVLTFRNVHNWMTGDPETDYSAKTFKAMFDALKPGGTLGVVEHRANIDQPQDPGATNGYVREDHIIALAEVAGFEFVGRTDVNANPKDTKDHPFGVWTLPPVKRTAAQGAEPNPDFDRTKYDTIGESDRMTLKFKRPE